MKRTLACLLSLLLIFSLILTARAEEAQDMLLVEWGRAKVRGADVWNPVQYPINTNKGTLMSVGWDAEGYGGYGAFPVEDGVTLPPVTVSGDCTYCTLEDGTIALLDIDDAYQTKKLVIPAQIDGKTVTRLGYDLNVMTLNANMDRYFLADVVESVVIPDTVRLIAPGIFAKKGGKLKISFPDSLESLGSFLWDNSVTKLRLPKNLKVLGDYAFADTDIADIRLPDGLREIGFAALMEARCKSITIPGSVQKLGPYLCCHMPKLTSAKLKNGLTVLPEGMFMGCRKLKKIEIPATVTAISSSAFEDCEALSALGFAKKAALQSIGDNAFKYTGLRKATLPAGLVSIGEDAFFGCEKLASVVIPSSVESIGMRAFDGCSEKLVLSVEEGSYAESYAHEHGLRVKVTRPRK